MIGWILLQHVRFIYMWFHYYPQLFEEFQSKRKTNSSAITVEHILAELLSLTPIRTMIQLFYAIQDVLTYHIHAYKQYNETDPSFFTSGKFFMFEYLLFLCIKLLDEELIMEYFSEIISASDEFSQLLSMLQCTRPHVSSKYL